MGRTHKSIILKKIREAGFYIEDSSLSIYRNRGSNIAQRIDVEIDPERRGEDGLVQARLSDMKILADLFGKEDFTFTHGHYDDHFMTWTLEISFLDVDMARLLSEEAG